MATDNQWMQAALGEAQVAADAGEVPVGAVVVREGEIVGWGHNRREGEADPIAHAEILAIQDAARRLQRWRLNDCTLYVTLEPCPMCAGAIVNARIGAVVYGTPDPRAGAAGSVLNVVSHPKLNHRARVSGGVEAEAAAIILRDFFLKQRE